MINCEYAEYCKICKLGDLLDKSYCSTWRNKEFIIRDVINFNDDTIKGIFRNERIITNNKIEDMEQRIYNMCKLELNNISVRFKNWNESLEERLSIVEDTIKRNTEENKNYDAGLEKRLSLVELSIVEDTIRRGMEYEKELDEENIYCSECNELILDGGELIGKNTFICFECKPKVRPLEYKFINDVMHTVRSIYFKNFDEKGTTWKHMDRVQLFNLYRFKVDELDCASIRISSDTYSDHETMRKHIIDTILYLIFLHERYKE